MKKIITLMLITAAFTLSGFSAAQDAQGLTNDIHTATVKEMQIAGSYVYLLVVEDGEEAWLATSPEFIKDINYGDVIEYVGDVEMQDFHSKALDKTFETLVFVAQIRVKQDDAMESSAEEVSPQDP